jgi:phage/plasmid-like protein (TIGR03299 family)
MSKETLTWLNQNVLIGNTDKRGHAWHYKASEQGGEPNHYPGFIPVHDVERRLFAFDPVAAPAAFLKPITPADFPLHKATGGHPDNVIKVASDAGVQYYRVVVDEEHQAIVDPDNDIAFQYPTTDYRIHNYREWLLKNVATVLDADLGITSAGLLRRRAQAWVEISVPENIETPEGVVFRPLILAWTSLDSTLATNYGRRINETVCDNTLHARIGEPGETVSFRHTAGSLDRVGEVRAALGIIYDAADTFSQQVHELCSVKVTDRQWQKVLDALCPTDGKEGRGLSIVTNKREKLGSLYTSDPRCAPWKGTKFGVVQTANTFNLHHATIRNTHGGARAERNQLKIISGQVDKVDQYVAAIVDEVVGV